MNAMNENTIAPARTRTAAGRSGESMPFEGSGKAKEIIGRLDAFLRDELEPLAAEHGIGHEKSADHLLLRRVWKRSHELGFYGMTLPEAMGGAGLCLHDHVLVKEFIYSSGSTFAPHVLGELSGPPRVGALVGCSTPDQMSRFIEPVARAQKSICFAITEAEAGSDAGAPVAHRRHRA